MNARLVETVAPRSRWALDDVVDALAAANTDLLPLDRAARGALSLPSREALEVIVSDLQAGLFPAHFGASDAVRWRPPAVRPATPRHRAHEPPGAGAARTPLAVPARRAPLRYVRGSAPARRSTSSRVACPPSGSSSAATRVRPTKATRRRPAPTRPSSATPASPPSRTSGSPTSSTLWVYRSSRA